MTQRILAYNDYYDRVHACWLGKSLGGVVGAPFECHKQFNPISVAGLWPDKLWPNDDLDIQVVYLEALQELGLDLNSRELAEFWRRRCFYNCCEYGVFIDNLEHGIQPPLSGRWNNDWFQASEGCPIRSEIWGCISPGNPALAQQYAALDGCLDHADYSIGIEKFLSAAAALSFFEESIQDLLAKTCAVMPPDNPAVAICQAAQEICAASPEPYTAWLQIVRRYGHRDSTRAAINTAFAIMALILGRGDFKETMRLCVQAGWDCDCTAATAGALLGLLGGTAALPRDWLEKLGRTLVCAVEIKHQFQPIAEFAAETCQIGLEMAQSRNPAVEIVHAPAVAVRVPRAAQLQLSVSYPSPPVLLRAQGANLELWVDNPTAQQQQGVLRMEAPAGLCCNPAQTPLTLPAGESAVVEITLARLSAAMPEINLLQARFAGSTLEFGLAGTKRLLVYGPYWDMWDKDRYPECPYQRPGYNCNPGNLPEFLSDAMNTHVRFEHSYLDEARLLRESLPAERPVVLESAARSYSNRDLGNFTGSACWYVETTVRALQPAAVKLSVEADCPLKCWFDGQEVFTRDLHTTAWFQPVEVQLSATPQRLILKLVTHLDVFHFGFAFLQESASRTHAVSPFFNSLEYL
ncbi:MAG: ADP-ribosylglycohydrolase family protein [Oligosphaeraceae bacterium]|nr:ADP-ribosylglycohydrolase family protein [Oligosphaeraceae bacterium]